MKRINFNTKWHREIRAKIKEDMDKSYPRGTNEQTLFNAIVDHATMEKIFQEIANYAINNTEGYAVVDPEKADWYLEDSK